MNSSTRSQPPQQSAEKNNLPKLADAVSIKYISPLKSLQINIFSLDMFLGIKPILRTTFLLLMMADSSILLATTLSSLIQTTRLHKPLFTVQKDLLE